jgi:type II secretory pathway component GspD/PulD (secretin)
MLIVCGLALGLAMRVEAQSSDTKATGKPNNEVDRTIFLNNATQPNDLADIQTDLRNMFPSTHIYGLPSQHAISIRGSAEDIAEAEKIVAVLDKARPTFRLTFTLTGSDETKGTGGETFTLVASSGEKAIFKQGSRVPIVTGHYDAEATTPNSQVQYMDVGLSIEVTAVAVADGVGLKSKVEQSSVSEQKSGVGPQDPVFQQAVLEATTALTLGKPVVLGSIGNPETGHKQEISVVAERAK